MTDPAFLFLAGDSFPKDAHVEEALRVRLTVRGSSFLGQRDICGSQMAFDRRKALLCDASRAFAHQPVIAIGRSSGGRIATLAAFEGAPLTSVVALGYPFRAPGKPEEPTRTSHLAKARTPALILQGDKDCYGSKAVVEKRYPLSERIQIVDINTDHEFVIPPEQWDEIAERIFRFARGLGSRRSGLEADHALMNGVSEETTVRR